MAEVYSKVLTIDSDIRSLKSSTPRDWWDYDNAIFSGDHMVQFWHFYLLVRTHVHSAMSSDEHDQYKYSRLACSEACQNLAQRYGHVRQHLPPGFFICRIIDMQVFSAAVVLVLSCYEQIVIQNGEAPTTSSTEVLLAAVQYILTTMESVSGQVSSEFVKEAAAAIKSLLTLLENPAAANSQGLTLRIPLLGRIHIAAKQQASAAQKPELGQPIVNPTLPGNDATVFGHAIIGSTMSEPVAPLALPPDQIPWYMELDMGSSTLQDPFMTDDFGNWDQYTGLGGFETAM